MCQPNREKQYGFSMIELLVTLVMLGLIASFVAPGVSAWLSSRETASLRMEISSKLALLPLQANRSGEVIVISDVKQLNLTQHQLIFERPIVVLANGFCKGGAFTHHYEEREFHYNVLPPYCEVVRSESI